MNALYLYELAKIEAVLLKNHISSISAADRFFVSASLVAIILWNIAPHTAVAQAASYRPFLFAVNDFQGVGDWPLPGFSDEYFTKTFEGERSSLAVPDPRVEVLREYLSSKNSPLTDHAETLLKLKNYRFVIGISFAESNFCKRNIRPHNCWGIGGGNPESYADYEEAVIRADSLIQKYHNSGRTTPKLMRDRWVGWKNHNWPLAVEQVIGALESRGL